MKPKKNIQFSEQFPVYDVDEAPDNNRQAEASRLSAPAWARGLSWLFVKPLRLGLIIGCLDVICASLAQAAAFIFCIKRLGVAGEIHNYLPLWAIYNILLIIFIYLGGGYGGMKDRRPEGELSLVTKGNILAILLLIVINFIGTKSEEASRYIFIIGFILSLSSTLTVHFALRGLLNRLWRYGLARENLLIVGDSSKDIRRFLDHLHIQRYKGFNILGYVAETLSATDLGGLQYLGRFQDLTTIHENNKINKVLFAMQRYTNDSHQLLKARLEECANLRISALILSHIINDYNFDLFVDGYSGVFLISSRDPAYSRALFWFGKRCIDIFVSLLILEAVAPLLLVLSLCIKLQDGGSILFKHRLVGKGGKMFDQLKFRTMVMNSEEILKSDPKLLERFSKDYKLDNDPRITRIGKWLRKYSLDELPQLVNVLKGEMSLVGPRPVKEEELPKFGHFQNARLKIRPGLTGYWQVNGRSTTSYEERVQMDKFYMQKCTIWMDLFILLKTPLVVIMGHGAV